MKLSISKNFSGGDIKVKKRKSKKSPLSHNYKKYLNHENIELKKKIEPTTDDIKINVIKKDSTPTTPCKRKRVRFKDGKANKEDIEHNKKCEKQKPKKQRQPKQPKQLKQLKQLKQPKQRRSKMKNRLSKRHTIRRRVSLRNLSKKKGKNINQEIQLAKKMSDDKIKDELLKSGIIIKGNQQQLMRDIYVFSNLGGINIRKE
tara:strand:+ start:11617 stop:12222 length:606 start_codon:yes stop_codon:yes gene_type:complete